MTKINNNISDKTLTSENNQINNNIQKSYSSNKNVSTQDFMNIDNFTKPKSQQEIIKEEALKPAYNLSITNSEKIKSNLNFTIFKPLTAKIEYPHIAIGSFARAFRDYIHYTVYDKFKGIIFGSYNRAIQNYIQRIQNIDTGDNTVDFSLPIFNYTIQIESPDDKLDMPWRNTTYFPGVARVLYPSFYKDDDFELKLVYRRLKGTINSNIYCNSEAELLDIQMAFYDAFRGLNTFSVAKIRTMTILPDHILFLENNRRRISKTLNSNKITKSFIPAVNGTHYYIFNNINAIINMSSISASNNYYGGAGLPEFSLNASFSFEIEIPQYILCMAKQKYVGIAININVAYKYEDDRVIDAIKYITGNHMTNDIEKDPFNSDITSFENGWIIDKVAYTIPEDSVKEIPFMDLFKDKQLTWNYKNRDIIVMIVYSGGVIRIPIDKNVAEYTADGNISLKMDLFNKEDLLEIYVFKLNKDIEYYVKL